MTPFICSKCGNEYKRKANYEKHIKTCTGKKAPSKKEQKPKTKKITEQQKILERLENIELRLSKLEDKFRGYSIVKEKDQIIPKSAMIFPTNSEIQAIQIIKNIINENSNLYSIKGVIPLEDLKIILNKNYHLTNKEFEDTILKLYRKQIIDLQAGGIPDSYHLKSPTGKQFYYLIIKEN